MMDIKMIFRGADIAEQIAGYLGIIETMDVKLGMFAVSAGSEFEAAIRLLEQAATSQSERDSLLREARSKFNKAIFLENSERLALSCIGLALCHFQLGDDDNGQKALRAVNLIKLGGVAKTLEEGQEEVGKALVIGEKVGNSLAFGCLGLVGLLVVGLVAVRVEAKAVANVVSGIGVAVVIVATVVTLVISVVGYTFPISSSVASHYNYASRRKKLRELQDSVQQFLETE